VPCTPATAGACARGGPRVEVGQSGAGTRARTHPPTHHPPLQEWAVQLWQPVPARHNLDRLRQLERRRGGLLGAPHAVRLPREAAEVAGADGEGEGRLRGGSAGGKGGMGDCGMGDCGMGDCGVRHNACPSGLLMSFEP